MNKSERRKKMADKKRAAKKAQMATPGYKSIYAQKRMGIYPPNSPFNSESPSRPSTVFPKISKRHRSSVPLSVGRQMVISLSPPFVAEGMEEH